MSAKEAEDRVWQTVVYVVEGLGLDEAAAEISRAIGVELLPRHSTFLGHSYKWRDEQTSLGLKGNWIDDGEPVYPGIPVGPFVEYSSIEALRYVEALDGLEFLKLHNRSQWPEDEARFGD